ncbi:MAG: division/cell wall cluster transcriptional repressor MraZ [Planctomycetaceae bacterium]
MAQIFTGTFVRSLDGKNRLLVPSELRDVMDGEDRRGVYVIPSSECLFLWPQSYLLAYASGQATDPFGNRKFNRTFYSRALFKAFDGAGRIVLPAELVARFPNRELLIAGAGLYMEAWDPAAWESHSGELKLE